MAAQMYPGSDTTIDVGTVVHAEINPGKSLLVLLWLPPSLMTVATLLVLFEYRTQRWTPLGQTIDGGWTPRRNVEARSIVQNYLNAQETWTKANPHDTSPPEIRQEYDRERRMYRERHAHP